jgi:tRNA pseudouridine55 synthase
MDGLIVIDKPRGCTSHDVVLKIRRLSQIRKVGHCGTLDPNATGVLLIAVGRAVRFFPYLSKQNKTYEGRIRLGFSTDSYDASGNPTSEEKHELPPESLLAEAIGKIRGEILQLPPPYSAKKINGKPMYRLARAQRDFVRKPSRVEVHQFRLVHYAPPFLDFEAVCSSGTYVRSLAHDLGEGLGCGAHILELRRTASGPYSIRSAKTIPELEESGRLFEALIPLEELLPEWPRISLRSEDEIRIRNGNPIPSGPFHESLPQDFPPAASPRLRLFDSTGRLLALATLSSEKDRLLPFLVIS